MADFDRNNPTAPMTGYGQDRASPDGTIAGERDRPLTDEEMASLFDEQIGSLSIESQAALGFPQSSRKRTRVNTPADDLYQAEAEQYFQAGRVVGKGDATFRVKAEIKRMGCKWHALRERWVAPSDDILRAAKEVVKRGPVPVGIPGPCAPPRPQARLLEKLARASWGIEPLYTEADARAFTASLDDPPPPGPMPGSLLIDLEERGLIKLQPGRMEALLSGAAPNADELALAFAESDRAFEL